MQGLHKKRRLSHVLQSKIALLVLLFLVLFFGKATWNIFQKERESKHNAEAAAAELAALEERERVLGERIARLKTPEGVEEELRGKYTITKEGEDLYVIVDQKPNPEDGQNGKKQHWWSRIFSIFN